MSLKIDRVQLEIVVQQDKARAKMIELETSMRNAQSELKKIKKQFGENSVEYARQQDVIKKLKQEYDDLFDEIGIGKLSLKELANRQRELNAILRNIDPSLPQWRQYNEQLRQVNNRIAELRQQGRQTSLSLSKFADGFNRYAGLAAGAIASMTGVALTARKCVDEYATMEEAMSQVIKYTGMTRDEVLALNEEFKRMDTRTPREKLNALAGDAGRLGITSREAVKEFVDAANIINVALGEDLGEDAVKNIGKLAQMFGEDQERGLRGAMLATASAVNEVAQNSSAAEQFLVEFTARVAGVGQQAGLTQADIIGLAAAMDENMLRNETSATAFQKVVMKMFSDTEKFAKAAGLDLQEFSRLVRSDANEAILQFAEALSKKGGLADLSQIFGDLQTEGAGVSSMLSVMASKADQIRERQQLANQAYRDGTSAINEYNVQNNTVQAQLDKAKEGFKNMRIELGEKLLPYMKYMISTGRMTIDILATLIGWTAKHSKGIIAVATAIGIYTVAVKAASVATNLWRAATTAAAAGMRSLNAAMKANGIAAVVSLLASGVAYLISWRIESKNAMQELDESAVRANETLTETARLIDKLSGKDGLNDRQKQQLASEARQRIEELEDLMVEEKNLAMKWYEERKAYYRSVLPDNEATRSIKSLEKQLAQRLQKWGLYKVERDKLMKQIADIPKEEIGGTDASTGTLTTTTDPEKAYREQSARLATAHQDRLNTIKMARITEQTTEEQYQQQLYQTETAYLMERKALMERYGQDTSQIQGQIYDRMIDEANRIYTEHRKLKDALPGQILDTQQQNGQQHVNAIKTQYLNGDIDSHQAMLDAVKEAERKNLEERIALMETMGMDATDLKQRLLDMQVQAHAEAEQRMTEDSEEGNDARKLTAQDAAGAIGDSFSALSQLYSSLMNAEVRKVESRFDKEITAARKAGKDTTSLEEQKEAAVLEVKKKYADKQFAMNVLTITADTAQAVMRSWAELGPILGPIYAALAVAEGAAQLVVAKQQRDEANGLYSGGYSEGYTGSGDDHEVAGVIPVHRNEFVANHEAVANPAVRQFLDVFDVAQRNGSIRVLDTSSIIRQVQLGKGLYEGGYSATSTGQTAVSQWSTLPDDLRLQITRLMQENNDLLREIRDKDLVLDPRKVRDSIATVTSMERNVSRH